MQSAVSPRVDDWLPWVADVTFPTEVLPLSDEEVEMLLAEEGEEGAATRAALEARIQQAVDLFEGNVFVRMSCLSAKDATLDDSRRLVQEMQRLAAGASLRGRYAKQMRLLNHALYELNKVRSGQEALAMLRSSNRVRGHLERNPQRQSIIVRRWCEIDPAFEFRAFVRAGRMIAVSHYYRHLYHPQIAKEKARLLEVMEAFFESSIKERVPLPDYVCDFVIDPNSDFSVTCIELNPYAANTSSALFSWEEIENLEKTEFRVLQQPIVNVLQDHVSFRLRACLSVAFDDHEQKAGPKEVRLVSRRERRRTRRLIPLGETRKDIGELIRALEGRCVVLDDLRLLSDNVRDLSGDDTSLTCAMLLLISAGASLPAYLRDRLIDEVISTSEDLEVRVHNAKLMAREFKLV